MLVPGNPVSHGSDFLMAKVAVPVKHSRAVLFSILKEIGKYPEWIPGCEQCKIVSSEGQVCTVDMVLNSMKRISLTVRFDAEPDQLIKFEMVGSKDVKAYAGSYKLMNAADGSSVFLGELELDPGAMAPKFVVERMLKSSLEATGQALGKRAASMPPPAATPAAATEAQPGKNTGKSKVVLRVVKTDAGERIWYGGKTFGPQ